MHTNLLYCSVSDAGKYMCRVKNDYSYEDSRWCKLTVERGDPAIVSELQTRAAIERERMLRPGEIMFYA